MPRAQPNPPDEHVIPVVWNAETMTLEVIAANYLVQQGDLLIWQMVGIPDGWSPWVLIDKVEQYFDNLNQSSMAVWGRVRGSAPVGQLSYQVSIQREIAVPRAARSMITSRSANLDLRSAGDARRLTFEVFMPQEALQEHATAHRSENQMQLEVVPAIHQIRPGDSVAWDFSQVRRQLPDCLPRVNFKRYVGNRQPKNFHLGPFASWSFEGDRVIGRGSCRAPGSYFFYVSVLSMGSGGIEWVSSVDPCVDDLGDPAQPGSG